MRAIFLLGGFVGFLVGALSAAQAGRGGDRVLLDGSVGCLVGAMLFRWFWSTVITALTHAVKAKRAKQALEEEAAAANGSTNGHAKPPLTPVKAR